MEYQVDESQIDKNLISLQDDGEAFNQFEINKEKFNVQTSYCESKYTTVLNYDYIPEDVKQKAKKIENDILNQNQNATISRHLKEERGILQPKDYQDDDNDEFIYSSVYRDDKIN